MTTYWCNRCGNGIMTTFERRPKGQTIEEYVEFLKVRAHTKRTIVCRCCIYPKEVECLTKCKMYDECKNPNRKEKRKKMRYIGYDLS